MTAFALAGYYIGLAGYAEIKDLSPAFYALDEAKIPMVIAISSIAVNAVASFCYRFFFQAEDGIRDRNVTGVQTCALPISTDGLRFVQFYFGLPLAMVILGVTLVPFLHGARVFTAYEYLERRFDARTRSLTSFLFLVARGMSCGTIIAAPAVVFSAIFGWSLLWSVALMGVPTVIYTMIGGVQAVTWVD